MDSSSLWACGLSFAAGWIVRGSFDSKPEIPPCACHCSCNNPIEGSPGGSWGVYSVVGLIITVGVVLAAIAVLALKVTVRSPQGEQEVAVHLKGKSKGIYGAPRGFQLAG